MIVYEGVKSDFMRSIEEGTIAESIERKILEKLGKHTAKNEFRSWENSMQYMYTALNDSEIPQNSGVAIEYNLPHTSKRVDFIITGYNTDSKPNAVIIELKQWDSLKAIEGSDSLVETFVGGGKRTVVHPSYQAWSYAALINDYNKTVRDKHIDLFPCAFMHNYPLKPNDPVISPQYNDYLSEAPVFAKGDILKLRSFIKKSIHKGDDKTIIYDIDHGVIRPSKSLQDAISKMIAGNKEFIMIDDQKVVYDEIINCSKKCFDDKKKRTIIVEGGPGTGKSVIAVNLLAELTRQGQFVQYVSKNSAPRTVYQKKLKGTLKKSSVDNMFKGSGIYTDAENNIVNTIIVDEAHRLNEKSGMFKNMGENQIKEIIHASICSVFFIDESQRVTLSDIGSVSEIEKWAKREGSKIVHMELLSQFRCNGSDGYLAWVDNTLEIRDTANFDLNGIDYDIRVFDDVNEMREAIVQKNNENHRSRLLAGYCWDWIENGKNSTDCYDIVIGDFRMSWNLGNSIFAIDDSSINEVGCIHTSQGLEFDYVGVIIGDDMRYDGRSIVTDFTKRASTDQSLKGIKKLYKSHPKAAQARADEIIKNTYRTLMTRGMKGCYIYCTDSKLSEYIKSMILLNK